MADTYKNAVQPQPFCNEHQAKIVEAARTGPQDRWMTAIIIASVLMVGPMFEDHQVMLRCSFSKTPEGNLELDIPLMNLVLAELGCPGCSRKEMFRGVQAVLRKGLDHAAALSQRKILDPDFPWIREIHVAPPDQG